MKNSSLLSLLLALVLGCGSALAQPTQPATHPTTAPAVSPLDRAPLVYVQPRPQQTHVYIAPGDLSRVVNRAVNVCYECSPDGDYSLSGPITAANVTINGHGSRLHLHRLPGSGCDVNVNAPAFTLQGFAITGDGTLAFRVDAPGATFCDLTTAKMDSFVFDDRTGYSCTLRRCSQADFCGGQWFYGFADSALLEDCQLTYGSPWEEPIRFSPDGPNPPPVGCIVRGGMINQLAGPKNKQKSAFAIRGGNVSVDGIHFLGAMTGGQISGTDTAVVTVTNCTFDADPIYPSISMQRGVRLKVSNCRFRGGGQPISVDVNSIVSAIANAIELPNGKVLIDLPGTATEDGTGTIRTPATTQPTH